MTYSGSLGTMYQRASANTQAPPVLQSASSQRAPVNQYVAPRPTLPPIGVNLVAPRPRALPHTQDTSDPIKPRQESCHDVLLSAAGAYLLKRRQRS